MQKMYLLLCLLSAIQALGQAPVSETIHVNSIEAKVWNNGSFFGYNNERSFKIPVSDEEGAILQSVFKKVSPWLGAYDDFGNIKVSAIAANGIKTDFAAGIPNIAGYDGFWKVSKAQIQAHWQDFTDNGVVDNPDDTILQWPGTRMVPIWSGASEPLVNTKLAPYFDFNSNNVYDPLQGDYPLPQLRGCHVPGIPDEIVFFTFHDQTLHPASNGHPLNMQILCTMWAYSCPEDPTFNNSIFMSLDYWNRGDPLDSIYTGILMSLEIGEGDDDFIGCAPEEEIYFGYNGDSIDEDGFEEQVPLVGVFRFGINELPDISGFPSDLDNGCFMRVGEPSDPFPTAYPSSPQTYYGYLNGFWKDGTPLRSGGNGYHPLDTSAAVHFIYPDTPDNQTGWSEPSAGNTPGIRRALVSFRYPRMSYQERQRANYCFTWLRHPDSTYALSWAIEQLAYRKQVINTLIGLDKIVNVEPPPCIVGLNEPVNTLSIDTPTVTISPNPVYDYLQVSSSAEYVSQLLITNLAGQVCYQSLFAHERSIYLNINLPPGIYFLTVLLENNAGSIRKVMVVQ
ncbi:MAG: T9SS type A sorting domain-containing protein [Saprospiraceae bacterium]|nr:T9SS type A sorting domain-containing protein [Saprospiraceae bacterium]